jgi:hypothetical protein
MAYRPLNHTGRPQGHNAATPASKATGALRTTARARLPDRPRQVRPPVLQPSLLSKNDLIAAREAHGPPGVAAVLGTVLVAAILVAGEAAVVATVGANSSSRAVASATTPSPSAPRQARLRWPPPAPGQNPSPASRAGASISTQSVPDSAARTYRSGWQLDHVADSEAEQVNQAEGESAGDQ